MSRQTAWEDELGFTLVELAISMSFMGLVFALGDWNSTLYNLVAPG